MEEEEEEEAEEEGEGKDKEEGGEKALVGPLMLSCKAASTTQRLKQCSHLGIYGSTPCCRHLGSGEMLSRRVLQHSYQLVGAYDHDLQGRDHCLQITIIKVEVLGSAEKGLLLPADCN